MISSGIKAKTVVVITGANSGIGYQTVLSLLRSSSRGYSIFVGARSLPKAEEAINQFGREDGIRPDLSESEMIPMAVDLESDESIRRCFEDVRGKTDQVDVLINNAGASFDKTGPEIGLTPREIFQKTFEINVTGTHLFTHTFIPLLLNSPDGTLLFLTSGSASLTRTEDKEFSLNESPPSGWPKPTSTSGPGRGGGGGYLSYKTSKVALNMIMREWVRILGNDENIKVFGINPGTVLTNFGGHQEQLRKWGAKDPSTSGEFIRSVIEGERDKDWGKIINPPGAPTGEILPW
ncbi:uncharacterized protein I303_104492 [Kwoniella dejecticola CBS 10117]|uniref:Short-chain dehydrogenase n=1 Tax=Kwoniella dejecticola CBS 10117 TaxID=1296121 RepID=A0A1A6A580_9TREE|nr:uncharacterized protein I303_04530 [Kwoniella dejecticola CBS 10117]OBR85198.1 hypothetical protein I303_04530 [Kwoniella dejecticola CBS 10117]